jgi:RNA polymerase sigma factor (sigma-70 family)
VDALALAYRNGDRGALLEIHASMRVVIEVALARAFQLGPLPGPLERRDLEQQSWILLAELLERWEPAQGAFLPYAHGAFPWALRRYLRSQASDRRSRRTKVVSAEHETLFAKADAQTGVDGREWDGLLVCHEVMAALSPQHQRTLQLHFGERRRPAEMASALDVAIGEVDALVKRAIRAARSVAAGRQAPDQQAELRRLVESLHAGVGPDGRLPGRAWVCARTGLSELRFARLVRILVDAGCILNRSERRPGRLAHATPTLTLEELRVKNEE